MTLDQLREAMLLDPIFKAGFDAWIAFGEGPIGCLPPSNPHASGSPEAARFALGMEQAELEEGSPDSWLDGGAGKTGILRDHVVT